MSDRAILFVDGNNWYHSLKELGLSDIGKLNFPTVAKKLVGPREWVGLRYYVGQVQQTGNTRLYGDQRRFLTALQAQDRRIAIHLGRLEPRTAKSAAAEELLQYLNALSVRIDKEVFQALLRIAHTHRSASVIVEKAVDVMLAVDMVVLAERDGFDSAYLLSADGDFTHAVSAVRALGKKVYVFSPSPGAQLAAAANAFIRPDKGWFDDCFAR